MRRAFEVFDRVRSHPLGARDALLDSDATLSEEVRSAVRELLAHDSPTGEFLGVSVGSAAAELAAPLAEALVPQQVGQYRVIRELGRGGFGRVYLAEQQNPRRQIAVKVLRAGSSEIDARRMLFEAEALARLDHPAIARVYECGLVSAEDPRPYIAMEYVEGVAIDRHAASLGYDARCELLERVCEGIDHAHRRGVLHRDLASKNILVDGAGRPRVIDFGLACTSARDHVTRAMTLAGTVLGTLRYMSPEQLSGDGSAVDTRTDTFALGVIAFEVMTGEHPYLSGSPAIGPAINAMLCAPLRRSALIDRSMRGDTGAVLLRCVERDPKRRYASAAALGADLRALRLREPVAARSYSALQRLAALARRHKQATVLAGVVAVLVTTLAVGAAIAARREAVAHDAAVNVLDAVLTHVIGPLAPRVGTIDERRRLLDSIERDVLRITDRDSDDARIARISGAYHGARGDLHLDRLEYEDAAREFARAVASYERAIAIGDDAIETSHAACLALVKSGDALLRIGGPSAEAYQRALEIDQRLAAAHPRDLRVLSNLFWSYWRHAEPLLHPTHGNYTSEAARVADAMHAVDPSEWRTLEAVARVRTRRGIEASFDGRPEDAITDLAIATDAARSLLVREPSALAFLKIFIEASVGYAGAALDLGRTEIADAVLKEGIMAVERIASANLDEDNHDLYVLAIRDPLARLALMRGDHESAIATAMSMLEEYARDPDPEVIADFAYLSTIRARQTLVVALRSVGRERDAADAHAELVAYARTAARRPSVSEIVRRWLVAVEAAP